MTNAADYLAYADASPAEGGELSQLADLANQQAEAEAEVAKAQAALTRAQERLKDIAERQVPELMDRLGMAQFKTASGIVVEVAETIRASIPKARSIEAMAWLRANGSEALIKRAVSVAFGKGEGERALELLNDLAKRGLPVEDNETVHPQTLSAWVREKLAGGIEVPLDLFGVFRQRVSKIKVAK